MKVHTEVEAIAARVRAELEKIYEVRLRKVYLYGSHARQQSQRDSDIDIAIVLDEVRDRFAEHERVSQLGSDLSLDTNELISFFFASEADLKAGRRAIHRAIVREGVPV